MCIYGKQYNNIHSLLRHKRKCEKVAKVAKK